MPVPLLDRPRLSRSLDAAGEAPLIVVSGMAGAGKSTAVRLWLNASDADSFGWIALDARDNDAVRFWSRFATAAGVANWATHSPIGFDHLDELIAHLEHGATRFIVFDDLHFVRESEVLDQLDYVLRRLSRGPRIVLISRSSSPVPLGRFRAEGKLAELGVDELAFTRDEIGALLDLDGAALDAVVRLTHGLPVAVALSRGLVLEGALERLTSARDLSDFLAEEFLAVLPDEVQSFVLGVAVLERVNVDVANVVVGVADSRRMLEMLALRGLILPDGASGDWVMHAVVRDFLVEELERRSPEQARLRHARASEFFEETDHKLAVTHALAAENPDRAVALIETHLPELQNVLYSTQLRWLQALPEGVIESRPALCAHAALVAAFERRFDLAARWLRRRDVGDVGSVEELGALTMQCVVLGDLPRQLEVAGRLHAVVDESSTLWDLANGALAGALHSTGNTNAALSVMVGMLRPVHARPEQFLPLQSTARAVVVRLLLHLGRVAEARTALDDLQAWVAEASVIAGFDDLGAVDWAEGMLALAEGDTTRASAWVTPPPPESAHGLPFLEVWLFTDFATVRAATGDEAGARRALYRVQTNLSRFADPGLLEDRLREAGVPFGIVPLTRHDHGGGALPGSLSEREQTVLELLDSELSVREIADHLFLSQNTVKAHVRSIYRKLGVSSRLSAVRMLRSESTQS